ncbi:hypothetical protein EDB85DRAFT_1924505 [Lactarius pseudohatsudake]|nr:hypothetical protein EDB85DRAFT_1924505 [Lactarius pseudohatsudake]
MSKEKNSACWHTADDATLIHTLTDQKAKKNWGDNNPKKVAWTVCEVALAGSEKNSGGTPKTANTIKNRWQRLKQEYEVIKELRGLSGFGWDDTKKLVTATAEVWDAYLAPRRNSPAKAFRTGKKTFPLYEDIGNLVEGTRATGANTFRVGQTPGRSDKCAPAPGPSHTPAPKSPLPYSNFAIDPLLLEQAPDDGVGASENELNAEGPEKQAINKEPGYTFFGSDKYSSNEDEIAAPETQGKTRKRSRAAAKSNEPRRKRRATAGESISDLSKSVNKMASSVSDAASKAATRTPQALAIAKIEMAEGFAPREIVLAIKCVMRDAELATAYLAISNPEFSAEIIREEIEKFCSRTQ